MMHDERGNPFYEVKARNAPKDRASMRARLRNQAAFFGPAPRKYPFPSQITGIARTTQKIAVA